MEKKTEKKIRYITFTALFGALASVLMAFSISVPFIPSFIKFDIRADKRCRGMYDKECDKPVFHLDGRCRRVVQFPARHMLRSSRGINIQIPQNTSLCVCRVCRGSVRDGGVEHTRELLYNVPVLL